MRMICMWSFKPGCILFRRPGPQSFDLVVDNGGVTAVFSKNLTLPARGLVEISVVGPILQKKKIPPLLILLPYLIILTSPLLLFSYTYIFTTFQLYTYIPHYFRSLP